MSQTQIETQVREIAERAKMAALKLAVLPAEKKNQVLETLAGLLEKNSASLIEVNRKDLIAGEAAGLNPALLDRLEINRQRIKKMADGIREVIRLPDPVNEELERTVRPNELDIRKVRAPIGVIGIIYESRPNVTVDCAALCFKSGNACILRGGHEAIHTNQALAEQIQEALREHEITPDAVQLIPVTDRYALHVLLRLDAYVHCVIPRGGEGLIRFVAETARMPVIKHYKGVCHVYVDKDADRDMAKEIVVNAKCQRPGVCNAIENLLIHESVAEVYLPCIARELKQHGVELRVDELGGAILRQFGGIPFKPVSEEDYYEEYLDMILAVKVVNNLEEAITFINKYGSNHSDAIVTENEGAALRFLAGVDSAAVYWNASTRFTDGYEFGLGAEIGISTDKIHARGPMGLRELTTCKYLIFGSGQTRH